MKFVYLLAICVLYMAAMASAQKKFNLPPPEPKNLPQLSGGGGGSRKQGFDVSLDARQKVWESQNKRHSVDATVGYSQHLGGQYGSSRPSYRGGVGYTYKFGKYDFVIKGHDAVPHSAPYIVSLRKTANNSHSCGGTIIAKDWILTAAHCIIDWGKVHEKYTGGVGPYDIAILDLSEPLEYNSYVQPASLPAAEEIHSGEIHLYGWGQPKAYILTGRLYIHETNLCSDSLQTSISACNGDSGGPLVIEQENAPSELVGIVSWGYIPCGLAKLPSIYTRVSAYIDWILNLPPPTPKTLPQLSGGGGGSRKQGFDVSLDASKKVWESQNKRHSVDASVGYSQHLGGPYGNSRPDYRGGVGYTYKFGKKLKSKYKMKFVYLLVICAVYMAAMVAAKDNDFKLKLPPPEPKNLPQLSGGGGGSRKQGFDVSLDASQKVWESQNKRHSVDASVGYSQHLGGPYGNSRPEYRGGVGYTYRFGKK
ncbi:transmembrane protease serine 11G-like [Lucilia sericata]|uniref:transmembrane protease serine 11G-like n=1 Tax=Lucilia sericata TaxID=13632 RepID=UPI0018A83FF5|nr:transmembrane protease serine 11G-like [Lucilia sericata]